MDHVLGTVSVSFLSLHGTLPIFVRQEKLTPIRRRLLVLLGLLLSLSAAAFCNCLCSTHASRGSRLCFAALHHRVEVGRVREGYDEQKKKKKNKKKNELVKKNIAFEVKRLDR
uniref:Transmembrane protein n=1 Tax=Candidozyma auris TaxID=498019 RepID=A0A0L0P8C5_CANAR